MRPRSRLIMAILAAIAVLITMTILSMLRRGFSAADSPSTMEAFLASTMRRYAVPSELKDAKNPLPLTPELLAEGLAHFADHCALCHGNDGKGKTSMGPNFYPKVPDMTLPRTQDQSDGELFAAIENGIRLTAMPAFGAGTAESAYGSWGLVHFIRHLPQITPEELTRMQKLNPKSPEEWRLAAEEEAFLAEGGEAPPPAPAHGAQPHKH